MALAVAISIAAPLAAYAAARNAAVEAARGIADPSRTLPPRSTWTEVKTMMRTARQPQARLPEGALDLARRGAVAVPLAYEPYFIAARVNEQAGRYRRATALMEEARRRRPNATSVRILLLGYYSLENAYQKAIDEADMAMRVNSRSMDLILPAFAKLVAADAKARQAIAVSLSRRPIWRRAFFEVAAREKINPEAALSLVADIRRRVPMKAVAEEEAFLVSALVASGQVQRARRLWEGYFPAAARAPGEVFDPSFTGRGGLAPFVWTLQSGSDGNAEIVKPGADATPGLAINFFGDSEYSLAEQTLAMTPGRYRLQSTASGESSSADVRLVWRVGCLSAQRSVGELVLSPLGSRPTRHETVLTVPSGCDGQRLALVGRPADLARSLSAQISNVQLVRLDQ